MIREFSHLNDVATSDSKIVGKVKELFKENPEIHTVNIKVTPHANDVELHFRGAGKMQYDPFDGEPVVPRDTPKPVDLGTKTVTLDEAKAVFGDVDVKRYKEYNRSFIRRVMFD